MYLLAPASNLPAEETSRTVRRVFVGFFLLGALLRLVASFGGIPFAHADEHQQYLEQAFRVLHGFGMVYWEQEEGIRHWFYPGCLAGVLWLMEQVGITDPQLQNSLFHFLIALIVFSATARFAWELHIQGDTPASLLLMISTSIFPDVIFVHCRLLTENVMMAPVLLGMAYLPRRPLLAGVLIGLSFGVRFHAGFLIAGMTFLAWWGNRDRKPFGLGGDFPKFVGGIALALVFVGLVDYATYGSLFFSPIQYVKRNLIDGKASEFGVDPWYQYFEWTALWGWPLLVLGVAVMLVGAWREWRILILLAVFFAVHCVVKHKEGRFLWPLIPFVMTLVSSAFGLIYRQLGSAGRVTWSVVAGVALLTGVAVRVGQVPWTHADAEEVSLLLREAGRRADLHGVAVYRCSHVVPGNYFFLQRDVELRSYLIHAPKDEGEGVPEELMRDEAEQLIPVEDGKSGAINYLIVKTDEVKWFARFELKAIETIGSRTLYQLKSPDR
jgi:hypothetical protein